MTRRAARRRRAWRRIAPSGVVAGCRRRRPATCWQRRSRPFAGQQVGGGGGDERLVQRVDVSDLGVEGLTTPRQMPQCDLVGSQHVVAAIRSQRCGLGDQRGGGKVPESVATFLGAGRPSRHPTARNEPRRWRRPCRSCRAGAGSDGSVDRPRRPAHSLRADVGSVPRHRTRCLRHRRARPHRNCATTSTVVDSRGWWPGSSAFPTGRRAG